MVTMQTMPRALPTAGFSGKRLSAITSCKQAIDRVTVL